MFLYICFAIFSMAPTMQPKIAAGDQPSHPHSLQQEGGRKDFLLSLKGIFWNSHTILGLCWPELYSKAIVPLT